MDNEITKTTSGFVCKNCGGNRLFVMDTRMVANKINTIRRRRICQDCGCKMTFYEISADEYKKNERIKRSKELIIEELREIEDDLSSIFEEV